MSPATNLGSLAMPALYCMNKLSENDQAELFTLLQQVIEHGINYQQCLLPTPPSSQALLQHAASFVTIYDTGELRGCIGTCKAKEALWLSVCKSAYSSAFEDNRFNRLQSDELSQLSFDISILSELSAIVNIGEQALLDELVPYEDGIILKEGSYQAVFLPAVWRNLSRPDSFIYALKHKAGWPENYWSKDIEIFRFTTQLYTLNDIKWSK